MALSANEARFFRFRVSFGACSLQNVVGDPHFLGFFGNIITFLRGKFKKKICAWELLGANAFKNFDFT